MAVVGRHGVDPVAQAVGVLRFARAICDSLASGGAGDGRDRRRKLSGRVLISLGAVTVGSGLAYMITSGMPTVNFTGRACGAMFWVGAAAILLIGRRACPLPVLFGCGSRRILRARRLPAGPPSQDVKPVDHRG